MSVLHENRGLSRRWVIECSHCGCIACAGYAESVFSFLMRVSLEGWRIRWGSYSGLPIGDDMLCPVHGRWRMRRREGPAREGLDVADGVDVVDVVDVVDGVDFVDGVDGHGLARTERERV